jgi:phosphonate transport system substrate-binding protein
MVRKGVGKAVNDRCARAAARGSRWLAALVIGLFCVSAGAQPTPAATVDSLRFGIIPIGGPAESKDDWTPLIQDMEKSVGVPSVGVYASSYDGMMHAVSEGRVDIAFLSGNLALEAVQKHQMEVVAQLQRIDGRGGYYSVLIANADGPIRTEADIINNPGRWRFGIGEPKSVSGYLVPELQFFASHGLYSSLHFPVVQVGNHQTNALAVANGEVDLATNNTADLEKFAQRFPEEARRIRVIWQSALIPNATILVRTSLPAALRERIKSFLLSYGRGAPSPKADHQRANLKLLHDLSGFVEADKKALLPFAQMQYQLERRRAEAADFVDPAARKARLQHIENDYIETRRNLLGDTP